MTGKGTDGQQRQVGQARAETARRGTGRGARGDGQQEAAQPEDGTDRAAAGDARTFTIELPAGLRLVTLNDRYHWRVKNRLGQAVKDAAIVMARKVKLPRLERVAIVAVYEPPDNRHRDPDNIMPAVKNAIDGICAAGCLPGDDRRYVTSVTCVIGEKYPKGRLMLHITEAELLTAFSASGGNT